jgi:uridine phosphorylase
MATTKIGNSELILNPDGSVYHLHLLPQDIAETILLVGDPDRVKKVSKHFDRIEIKKQKREFITHTGYIGKKRLSVLSTGIGTDNIDIVLNELDALVNVNLKTEQSMRKKNHCDWCAWVLRGLCKKT